MAYNDVTTRGSYSEGELNTTELGVTVFFVLSVIFTFNSTSTDVLFYSYNSSDLILIYILNAGILSKNAVSANIKHGSYFH